MHVSRAPLLLLAACGTEAPPASPCGPSVAMVDRVIDGDTIVLTSGEKVRYLLINANEITNGHDECYGHEAADYNTMLVGGQQVSLVYDQQCTDIFGRLLAYVSVSGREVNPLLVERGYACVLYIPPDGASRHVEFQNLELEARAAKVGMWGACPEVPCASK